MTYFFYIVCCLFLIVLQTSVIPVFPVLGHFYDLLVPFIIYLAFYRSIKDAIPILVFCGMLMDGLSGGTFGLYISIYLWLFVMVRWLMRFLHAGNMYLTPFVVSAAVAAESIFLPIFAAIFSPDMALPTTGAKTILTQILWGSVTGPFILFFFGWMQKRVDFLKHEVFTEKDELRAP